MCNLRFRLHYLKLFVFIGCILPMLTSCYSIRIANINGAPEPSDLGTGEIGYYADKKFTIIDTTIALKLYEHDAMFLEPCEEGGFYSVEYRVKFGDLLWNLVTLGTRKKVRVKYVCLKPQS